MLPSCSHSVASTGAPAQVTLVQVVPPGSGGVRDYVDGLQRQWAVAGLASRVIALCESEARSRPLAERLLDHADNTGLACTLLLHFSAYGYQRRGLCFWLLRELDGARAKFGDRLRLVTMFHELSASGPPWTSAFWLSGLQASIVSRVASRSDQLLTNSQHHARCLAGPLLAAAPVQVWPVFSTVGEPASIRPATERRLRLAVFGSESTRHRALQKLPRHAALLSKLGVREIVEAGSGRPCGSSIPAFEFHFAGRLDEAAIGTLLDASAFGLLDYPSFHLGKSTVFAAYAVHGCVVLNTAAPGPDADGLAHRRHFLSLDFSAEITMAEAERQAFSDAGRAWYAQHTLARQAASIARLCLPSHAELASHG